MKWLKTLILIAAMLLVGSLAAVSVNQEQIALKFAIWETSKQSTFWWLLLAFLSGITLGVLTGIWAGIKRRLENRKLRQSLQQANAELDRLRDLTLQS